MELAYKTVLVAVDGSEEAERALAKAIQVAKRNNAKLVITHVADLGVYTGNVYNPTFHESLVSYGEEILSAYKDRATEAEIEVETYLAYGSAKSVIPKDVAIKFNVDLIVCGAHGTNAVERLFIGSVSESITRLAKCDVLVVKK
ncbi:universal stress protein [Priestia taiwanensis]|uniref:Universal stress protein n=1 Tax=Priestia taiwanensis TaxID=1347902 RepID=A0A917ARF1_9BACI|nr:universal stress protein [Priestia taiwanensis]MBM7363051.1 nucleotide-binding universal stress UspA family protein [Priestia taiwanensis]GGE67208.1 universal stress protein [Priestia taiwanensis]